MIPSSFIVLLVAGGSLHVRRWIYGDFDSQACCWYFCLMWFAHVPNFYVGGSCGLVSQSEFLRICVWWSNIFDSLMLKICWDTQVSRYHVCLHSDTVNARKSFYACCCIQEAVVTWILIPCWRLIYLLNLYPNCSLQCLLNIFIVTWFRVHTRVR